MWDPSSLTRDQTHVPCNGRWILNHRTFREVPLSFFFIIKMLWWKSLYIYLCLYFGLFSYSFFLISKLNDTTRAFMTVPATAKSLQSCPTLCDPIDSSPPGSPVPGILQARALEWVAISFSNAWKWKMKVKSLSRVQLLATPWTEAYQAPPSMGFSRQEY